MNECLSDAWECLGPLFRSGSIHILKGQASKYGWNEWEAFRPRSKIAILTVLKKRKKKEICENGETGALAISFHLLPLFRRPELVPPCSTVFHLPLGTEEMKHLEPFLRVAKTPENEHDCRQGTDFPADISALLIRLNSILLLR